jgi:uncharacterized membrane protein
VPWLKVLHLSAVIIWCGALLYLPSAIAAATGPGPAAVIETTQRRILRWIFNLVATPAALVAIASGTAIFVFQGPMTLWLLIKLAVVGLLVLAHGLAGMLILRAERGRTGGLRAMCWAVGGSTLLFLGAIAWLVLRKPF